MKWLLVLLLLSTNISAANWREDRVNPAKLSPVDELVLKHLKFSPLTEQPIMKLTHPDVSTIKIYYTPDEKVIYAVWNFKKIKWDIMDLTKTNTETKILKGIPSEMINYEYLISKGDVGDYEGKYKKSIPTVTRTRMENITTERKGIQEFYAGDKDSMLNFYKSHNIEAAVGVYEGSRIYLFYNDGKIGEKKSVKYSVPNE